MVGFETVHGRWLVYRWAVALLRGLARLLEFGRTVGVFDRERTSLASNAEEAVAGSACSCCLNQIATEIRTVIDRSYIWLIYFSSVGKHSD
jgi:hypothetical protein